MAEVNRQLLFKGVLRRHQADGLVWIADHLKGVCAFDVGCGKTPTAIAQISKLIRSGDLPHPSDALFHTLWLTEASLIDQTVREFDEFLPDAVVFTADHPAMRATAKGRQTLADDFGGRCDVLVLGHEMAHSWVKKGRLQAGQLLVIDEAAKLRGGNALNQSIRSLARFSPRVIALTATIIENDPMELWHVLNAVNTPGLWTRREFEDSIVTWTQNGFDRWGRPTYRATGWSPHRLEEVRDYVRANVLRVTKEAAGLNLPQRVGVELHMSMLSGAQQAAYDTAERLGERGVQALEAAVLDVSEGSPILDDLLSWLGFHGEQQAVVASQRIPMLDNIAAALDEAGISYIRVDGSVASEDRPRLIQKHRDGDVRILLGSSVITRGHNLQHCRLLCSVGSTWNPAQETQREGRICRDGSPHQTYEALTLLPDTPLAQAQVRTLSRKSELARIVGLA